MSLIADGLESQIENFFTHLLAINVGQTELASYKIILPSTSTRYALLVLRYQYGKGGQFETFEIPVFVIHLNTGLIWIAKTNRFDGAQRPGWYWEARLPSYENMRDGEAMGNLFHDPNEYIDTFSLDHENRSIEINKVDEVEAEVVDPLLDDDGFLVIIEAPNGVFVIILMPGYLYRALNIAGLDHLPHDTHLTIASCKDVRYLGTAASLKLAELFVKAIDNDATPA